MNKLQGILSSRFLLLFPLPSPLHPLSSVCNYSSVLCYSFYCSALYCSPVSRWLYQLGPATTGNFPKCPGNRRESPGSWRCCLNFGQVGTRTEARTGADEKWPSRNHQRCQKLQVSLHSPACLEQLLPAPLRMAWSTHMVLLPNRGPGLPEKESRRKSSKHAMFYRTMGEEFLYSRKEQAPLSQPLCCLQSSKESWVLTF